MRVARHWSRLRREAVDAPTLKVLKAGLDGAWSKLVEWKVSLLPTGLLELDGL